MSATEPEIYLDAAATTPPLPAVIEAIQNVQAHAWANPSSLHGSGLQAAEALERARASIALALGAQCSELIVTSGATESVHLALLGSAAMQSPGRLVISAVEHPCVPAAAERLRQLGWEIAIWPVNHQGLIQLDQLDRLLAPPTRLVSLIWGQSEVGALQPVISVARACRSLGIRFHTDATQLIPQGRICWRDLPIDLLTLSAHKLQGPKGVGLLLRRVEHSLVPLQGGGGQQQDLRSGTEPVDLIAGLAVALNVLPKFDALADEVPPGASATIQDRRNLLLDQLLHLPGISSLGPSVNQRLPHHISLALSSKEGQPMSGRAVVRQLARVGIAASSGSACSSGRSTDSPILTAMGLESSRRQSGLRFTLGPWLSNDQLQVVPERLSRAMRAVDCKA
ncbi:MAG: cysteine desulfurase [Cyanobium sp. NAT70]|nr:cysteine desulfurase [Cyanobium sp. NAT70]